MALGEYDPTVLKRRLARCNGEAVSIASKDIAREMFDLPRDKSPVPRYALRRARDEMTRLWEVPPAGFVIKEDTGNDYRLIVKRVHHDK